MTRFLCWLFPGRAVANAERLGDLFDNGDHRMLLLELDRIKILDPCERQFYSRYLRLRYGLEDA